MKDIIFVQKVINTDGTITADMSIHQTLGMSSYGEDVLDQIIVKTLFTTRGSDNIIPYGVNLMNLGKGSKSADVRAEIALSIKQAESQIKAMQRGQGYPDDMLLDYLVLSPDEAITYKEEQGIWLIPLKRKSVSGRLRPLTLSSPGKVIAANGQ
ncbi:MAG: hypothetical protein WC455_09670 [Dehalococcoidia bacterium]|jgi:hypothetical protein